MSDKPTQPDMPTEQKSDRGHVVRFPRESAPVERAPAVLLLDLKERIEDSALKAKSIVLASILAGPELSDKERRELLGAVLDYLEDIETQASTSCPD